MTSCFDKYPDTGAAIYLKSSSIDCGCCWWCYSTSSRDESWSFHGDPTVGQCSMVWSCDQQFEEAQLQESLKMVSLILQSLINITVMVKLKHYS